MFSCDTETERGMELRALSPNIPMTTPVTDANKALYIQLKVAFLLTDSVVNDIVYFRKGTPSLRCCIPTVLYPHSVAVLYIYNGRETFHKDLDIAK